MRNPLRPILYPLVLVTLSCMPAFAQESRGSIVGRVADASGAVIPGATVKATNLSTNVSVSAHTGAEGGYQLLFLNPGPYAVTVEAPGFKSVRRENIELRINDRIGLDVQLEIGDVNERVVVTAESPLLETATANVGQVIDNRRIQELPMMHGSVRSMFFLLGGATLAGGGNSTAPKFQDPSRPASSSWLSFNGSPVGTTEFSMDGVPNTQTANSDFGSSMSNQPPVDAIQELKLETAYDASVGHTSGTHVNMVMKSGTNEAHGTAYFFYRSPELNANTFFGNKAGQARAAFDYKRGGFSLNGPVRIPKLYNGRDRTFFAYTYEIMDEQSQGYPFVGSVPTMEQRRGDFSALLRVNSSYQIYDPLTTAPAANGRFTRQPFAGNLIASSRISPIAQAMAKYWPEPNQPGLPDGTNNYALQNMPTPNFYQDHILRLDHVLNNQHRMYGRFARYYKTEGPYRDYFRNLASGKYFQARPFNLVLDDIYTPAPTWVFDLRYGYQRFPARNWSPSQGFDIASLGFGKPVVDMLAFRHPVATMFPGVNVSGLQGLQQETTSGKVGDDIHSAFADVNHPAGNHALKFGGEFRIYRKNLYDFGNGTPRFVFGTSYTNGPVDNSPSSPGGVGQGMAAFILGQPTSGSVDYNDSYAVQSSYSGLYVQDNWRVTSKLTVTLGLRGEYVGPLTERFNRSVRDFDPNAPLPIAAAVLAKYAASPLPELPASRFRVQGGLRFAGVGGQPRKLYNADSFHVAPRVGFSWNPLKNTVLRGGYGLYHLDTGVTSRYGPYQLGFSQQTLLIPSLDNGITYRANLANPFPDGIGIPPGNSQGVMTFAGRGISFYDAGLGTPSMQRWNLNIQQVLPANFMAEIGYAGSRATRLRIGRDYGALPLEYLSTSPQRDQALIDSMSRAVPNPYYPLLPGTSLAGTNTSPGYLLRPFTQFTSVSTTTNQGYSWYHGLQTRVERRFSRGFTFQFSYTYSKAREAMQYLNGADPMPYETISPNDRTHHVGVTAVYELPFGPGRALFSSAPRGLKQIIGGWQLNTVYNRWSGSPLSFGDIIFNGDIKNIPLSSGERNVDRWLNTGAGFERTPAKQFGYHRFMGPLYYSGIRSDGVDMWDFSLLKYTTIRDKYRVQFRFEAFNAFNTPNFTPPNTSVTSSAFGTVNGESTFTRQMQFGAKLVF